MRSSSIVYRSWDTERLWRCTMECHAPRCTLPYQAFTSYFNDEVMPYHMVIGSTLVAAALKNGVEVPTLMGPSLEVRRDPGWVQRCVI